MATLRTLAAALGTAAILASPLQAVAAAPTSPVQGGAIFIDGQACTIGHNDRAKGVSYTAAHCGKDGARVRLLERTSATQGNVSAELGTLRRSKGYDNGWNNDWATIEWDRGVTLGANAVSGDTVLTLGDLKRGDQVCYSGQATHGVKGGKDCGTFFAPASTSFTMRAEVPSQPGDSGGPIFVPGKGLVGIVSRGPDVPGQAGWVQLGMIKIPGKDYIWGATLADGKKLSDAEVRAAMTAAAGVDEAGVYEGILGRGGETLAKLGLGGSADSALSSGETIGKTGLTAGQLAAIIVPIVTIVLPLLSQLPRFLKF